MAFATEALENNERELCGTRERVRTGKANEPRPRRRKKVR